MSDNFLRIIPTAPDWTPDRQSAAAAEGVLRELCPDAWEMETKWYEGVRFIDQGENFECVRCPGCRTVLDIEWWKGEMDRTYRTRFTDLSTRTPCCRTATSLNDLLYDWPAGFAAFVINIHEAGRAWLNPEEVAHVSQALGHPIRQILCRY